MNYENLINKLNDLYIILSVLEKSIKLKNSRVRKIATEKIILLIFEIL